jgi:hypothetical protein
MAGPGAHHSRDHRRLALLLLVDADAVAGSRWGVSGQAAGVQLVVVLMLLLAAPHTQGCCCWWSAGGAGHLVVVLMLVLAAAPHPTGLLLLVEDAVKDLLATSVPADAEAARQVLAGCRGVVLRLRSLLETAALTLADGFLGRCAQCLVLAEMWGNATPLYSLVADGFLGRCAQHSARCWPARQNVTPL